jgi:hypothetical protein
MTQGGHARDRGAASNERSLACDAKRHFIVPRMCVREPVNNILRAMREMLSGELSCAASN